METTLTEGERLSIWTQIKNAARDLSLQGADTWLSVSTKFLQAHEQLCLQRVQTPVETREIDRVHSWLLDMSRPLQVSMLELGDRDRARQVASVAWHLNEAWGMAHNPMTLEEAKKLSAKIFPDEPRA